MWGHKILNSRGNEKSPTNYLCVIDACCRCLRAIDACCRKSHSISELIFTTLSEQQICSLIKKFWWKCALKAAGAYGRGAETPWAPHVGFSGGGYGLYLVCWEQISRVWGTEMALTRCIAAELEKPKPQSPQPLKSKGAVASGASGRVEGWSNTWWEIH